MSSSNEPKLGQLITDVVQKDAVHFALAPVVANENLKPGEHIGFIVEGNTELVSKVCAQPIGIVDPFLRAPVRKGEAFWMMLYPGTITGLRHEWTHPAYGDQRELATFWMRDFFDDLGGDGSFEDFMEGVRKYIQGEEKDCAGYFGSEVNYPDEEQSKEFYKYAQMLFGKMPSERVEQYVPFRCAC